ncbi:hypothetical protein [Streptomyces sp. NPDC059788]|uniref:hypothetical protein n=1 Tax=Streptomyces sp. NPDC059788 TaxID=3346948 RepID=UPI003655813C
MGRRRARAPGAGGLGALLCLLLALPGAGWIARDLAMAERPPDVWWLWAGETVRPEGSAVWVTTLLDPVLGLCCLFAAVAVLRRSPSAAGAPAAVAGATLLLRAPLLRSLGADGALGAEPDVRLWALITTGAVLVVSVLLLAAESAGRGGVARPAVRLRRAPAVVSALALGGAGLALAAWQSDRARGMGWGAYWSGVTGGGEAYRSLLQPPADWYLLSLVLLALVSAVRAAQRSHSARPLGLVTATLLLAHGAAALAAGQHAGLLGRFPDLAVRSQLDLATAAFTAMAGLAALPALVRPGSGATTGPVGVRLPPGYAPPPPPSKLPPNW